MTVRLETDKLRFIGATPAEQLGFTLHRQDREIGYDALFEGILATVLRVDRVAPADVRLQNDTGVEPR